MILLWLATAPTHAQIPRRDDTNPPEAARFLQAARRTEAAGDSLNAFFLYSRAAALNPKNQSAALQANVVGRRLMQTAAASNGADPRDLLASSLPPEVQQANRIALEGISATDAIADQPTAPVPRLKPFEGTKSFDLRGSVRPVIEEVLRGYQIKTIFEQAFQNNATVNFRVGDLTRDEALRVLETVTSSFFVPINRDTVLVFRDTTENRTNNAPAVTAVIPISDRFSVPEAQELASGVQQILELRRIAVDAGRHILVMRDQEYKILAARRLVSDLLRLRTKVQIDVELILVTRNSSLDYGFNYQSLMSQSVTALTSPVRLAQLGSLASSWFGLAIGQSSTIATMALASSQTTLHAQVVTLDGQQAQLHVGDQYPIVTGRGGFGTTASSIPTTQYRDLGLRLSVTPVVHTGGEMTLTLEAEYDALTGSTNNDIPIISNRKFSGTARLAPEEWAVISGLAVSSASFTSTGVAGLSSIPVLGHLFRHDTITEDSGQVLLLLKPRLLSEPVWERPTPAMWMGTETKPPTFY